MLPRRAWQCAAGLMMAGSVLGCGHPVATEPHDASAAQHQAAAERADGSVRMVEARSNPYVSCLSMRVGVCWTQAIDEQVDRDRDSNFYRQQAAQHRAAEASLRGAEAGACAGLAPDDRDISPFYHRPDIVSVEVLRADGAGRPGAGHTGSRTLGALVVFRAVPGLTRAGLQHAVNCHLARAAALGHIVPELDFCPLMPKGVVATVSSTAEGFAVAVTADDPVSAEEVWRRAAALMGRPVE
jgi:hypothetical protein